MRDFRPQVEMLRDELIARRRDFHQHPELAFEEVRTAGIVAQTLTDLGLEVQTGVGKTGVVALLEGDHEGPTVLVRCDMDALPIEEQNTANYRSQTPQKMHACGHDGHTSIGLTIAKMFNEQRTQMRGRIKFVFQPAEEIGRGAEAMIADGALNDPIPEISLGLHLWNYLPLGQVGITPGPTMAGSNTFRVKLTGRGGHAAFPHTTIDPVMAAAHITTALQSIVSRNVNPLDTAVLSVTQIIAGETHNVIPHEALLTGTMRFFNPDVRPLMESRFHTLVNGIAEAMQCQAEIVIEELTLPVINDVAVAKRIKDGFAHIAPNLHYVDNEVTMGAEDMAYFLEKAPGLYFFVGAANPDKDLHYPHHHPRFDFDEEALVIGASLLASAVSDYVLPD